MDRLKEMDLRLSAEGPEENFCCCEKQTLRTEEERKKLIHRLNRIEGQIRGIRNMLEKDAYCTDILVQVAAVNAALNAFNKELLAEHIKTCVAQDIRDGKEETIDEAGDFLYHMMVLLAAKGVKLSEVGAELCKRNR